MTHSWHAWPPNTDFCCCRACVEASIKKLYPLAMVCCVQGVRHTHQENDAMHVKDIAALEINPCYTNCRVCNACTFNAMYKTTRQNETVNDIMAALNEFNEYNEKSDIILSSYPPKKNCQPGTHWCQSCQGTYFMRTLSAVPHGVSPRCCNCNCRSGATREDTRNRVVSPNINSRAVPRAFANSNSPQKEDAHVKFYTDRT
jgi:hypothetical protein